MKILEADTRPWSRRALGRRDPGGRRLLEDAPALIEYVEYVFVLYTSMSIMFSMHRATTKTRSNPLSRGTMVVDLCQNEVLQQN